MHYAHSVFSGAKFYARLDKKEWKWLIFTYVLEIVLYNSCIIPEVFEKWDYRHLQAETDEKVPGPDVR
jgi:hypothetical protein